MSGERKTAIVTGGSQGIGAGLVKAFLERGYNVVANSRKITRSGAFEASDEVAFVDGNIAEPATAARIVETALSRFKSIDALVNNAGIFFTKPFTDYTPLHRDTPKDVMESLSPMGRPSTVKDITDAVMYLTDAATVTGDILYVDGGAHVGKW